MWKIQNDTMILRTAVEGRSDDRQAGLADVDLPKHVINVRSDVEVRG